MAKKETRQETEVKTVQVKLLKDHTHAGKEYKEGETLAIEKRHLAFLEAAGVIGKESS